MRGLRRLTFTRFIAAMLVVIFHFGKDVWPFSTNALSFLVHQGPSAVSYFYSLSGFVMAVAYPAIQNRPVDRQAFWVARFARIYPAFVLAMLFAIALSTNTSSTSDLASATWVTGMVAKSSELFEPAGLVDIC